MKLEACDKLKLAAARTYTAADRGESALRVDDTK